MYIDTISATQHRPPSLVTGFDRQLLKAIAPAASAKPARVGRAAADRHSAGLSEDSSKFKGGGEGAIQVPIFFLP